MKIAVDAMGGDFAPEAIVEGAIQAADEYGVSIVLVGQEDRVYAELAKHDTALLDIKVRHASQIVDMHDEPAFALRRKRDSSLHGAINLVRDGEADAAVSAGNTGAGMAIGKLACRPLEGIDRPALATVMPNISGETVLLDVGANVDCKPLHLLQFAVMGHVYAKELLKIDDPRVGLMSTGEEETKGNALTKEVFAPLAQAPAINFIGNVEGRDIFNGRADVIVCDGFVGNVGLKVSEGVAKTMGELLKEGFSLNWRTKLGYLLVKPAVAHLRKRTDYTEYGGAPLLGLNGVIIISHGSSKAHAMKNAIRVARESVEMQLPHKIAAMLEICELDVKSQKRARSFWRQLSKTIRHDDKDRHDTKDRKLPEKKEIAESIEITPQADIPKATQITEIQPAREERFFVQGQERRSWWQLRDSKNQDSLQVEPPDNSELSEYDPPNSLVLVEKPVNIREVDGNSPDDDTEQSTPDTSQKRGLWWHLRHRDHASKSHQEEDFDENESSDSRYLEPVDMPEEDEAPVHSQQSPQADESAS